MNRHAWVILALAAFFGLRTPLCLVACMEAGAPAPVASLAHDSGEGAPCHGSGTSAPESPAPRDHECDCDRFRAHLTKDTIHQPCLSPGVSVPPLAAAESSAPGTATPSPRLWRRHRPLPPPDILLLNSTLLI